MLSSEKSRSPSHQGWAKCPPVLLEPPGSPFISLHGQCLVWGLLCFSFCSVSPSRARTKSVLFSALSPVPSTGLLGTSPLAPFCGELNLARSEFCIFPSSLLPGSGTSEFDSPSPMFWPSLESWGGRWEEEGETAMALQRVRKPPCCLAAGTTGMVLAGAACWAEITMETRLGEGHWQWLRARGGGTDRDL